MAEKTALIRNEFISAKRAPVYEKLTIKNNN